MNSCLHCNLKFSCPCSKDNFCKHYLKNHSRSACDPKRRVQVSSPDKHKETGCIHHSPNYSSSQSIEQKSAPNPSNPEIFTTFNGKISKFEIPNYTRQTLNKFSDLPKLSSICVKGNKVFLVCGEIGKQEIYPNILMYSKKTEELEVFCKINTPRGITTSVILKDNLYIIGGYGQDRKLVNSIEKVNLLNKKTQVLDCILNTEKASATVFKDYIYICNKKKILIFDPDVDNIVADIQVINNNEEIFAITSCPCSIYILLNCGIYILQDSKVDFDLNISMKLDFGWTQQEIIVYNSTLYYIDYFDESLKEIQIKTNSNEFYSEDETNAQFHYIPNKSYKSSFVEVDSSSLSFSNLTYDS